MGTKSPELARQEGKAKRAWGQREPFEHHLTDVYTYCLPMRRGSIAKQSADRLFDMTSTIGAMYSAQNLKNDISPPGQLRVEMEAGPLARRLGSADEVKAYDRRLSLLSEEIDPFFQIGDFDTALEETCVDLMIGMGAIMPVKGSRDKPVIFCNIPADRIATLRDVHGQLTFASWKQAATLEAIEAAFPKGTYSAEFRRALKEKPEESVDLWQNFERLPSGQWSMAVYTSNHCDDLILTQVYRTQPLAVPTYFQDPGNPFGGGPLLYALPSIKTLNKAQELAVRSAAVQLLGIWGYRAGGTFNPDMVRVGAGEFWPMMSTGGVLGPDVQRLDPASGRLDVARMVVEGMRDDIKQVLFDNRLPRDRGTPKSASEIVARIQESARANIGAFGRISRALMPVIVPRVAEILFEAGYIEFPLSINEMLVTVRTRSPMQEALDAGRLQSSLNYFDLVQAVAGPEAADEHLKADLFLGAARKVLNVPLDWVPDDEEKAGLRKAKADQQAAVTAAQFALEAQKAAPEQPAGALI